jgi:ankyrin repeat protein
MPGPHATRRLAALAAVLIALSFAGSAQERTPMQGAMTIAAQAESDAILMNAVKDGDEDKVRELLAAYRRDGRDLPKAKYGETLLHMAAAGTSEPILRLLLEAGISPHVRGYGGITPLHDAARGNRPRMIALLLASGADINVRSDRGLTPLHVSNGTTQLLLDAGADPSALDEDGQTAVFQSRTDLDALLKAGLDINACNRHGWTPLHLAAFHASAERVRALLDRGAAIEAKTSAKYVIRSDEAWGSQTRSIPAGYTALDIAYNEHDLVKWVTGRNRPTIDLLRERGATRPFLGIRFLRW